MSRDMLCDTTIIRFTTLDAKIQCAPNKYVRTREILGDGIFRKHLLVTVYILYYYQISFCMQAPPPSSHSANQHQYTMTGEDRPREFRGHLLVLYNSAIVYTAHVQV